MRKFLVKIISEDRPTNLAVAVASWLEDNVKALEDFQISYAVSAPEYSAIIVVTL
jgi:hypothetical protein